MKYLNEFIFGNIDGKKELSSYKNENFKLEDVFFNYNDCFEKLKEKQFLIIGEKGTGKTLLIEYFKEKKKVEDSCFIDLDIKEIVNKYVESKEIDENINHFFKWEILSNICNYLIKNDIPLNKIQKKNLEKFLKKSPFDKNISNNFIDKAINFIKNIKIKKEYFDYSYNENYKNFLNSFFQEIITVAKNKPKKQLYIILDEIDIILREIDKSNLKKILEEVILVSYQINNSFKEKNIDIRIIISIREDIFCSLELTNANKLKEEAVILDWGVSEDKSSPLFKLVFNKMRNQDESLKTLSDEQIFDQIFKEKYIKISATTSISVEKYILGKTFLHPRDMIAFFEKIKLVVKDKTTISSNELQKIGNCYSSHIYYEIKDALVGTVEAEIIEEFLKLLKSLNKTIFKKQDLEKFLYDNKNGFSKINTNDIWSYIQIFYNVGLLGESCTNPNKKRQEYFKYKDENHIHISDDSEFTIHYGIRSYLKMSRERILKEEEYFNEDQKNIFLVLGSHLEQIFEYNFLVKLIKENSFFYLTTEQEIKEQLDFFIEKELISPVKYSKKMKKYKKTDKRNIKKTKICIYEEDYKNFLTRYLN